MIVKRDYYLRQLIAGRHNRLIKVVTGIRRSGKLLQTEPDPHQRVGAGRRCLLCAAVTEKGVANKSFIKR